MTMTPTKHTTLGLILTLALAQLCPVSATDADVRDTARKLSAAHRDSVVWLSVLAKTSLDAEGDVPPEVKMALAAQGGGEAKSEVTGTVIDASGLIVTSLSGLDKASLIDGRSVQTAMGTIKLKSSAEIKSIKVITASGAEVPADLVLKDEDLGLAFVKVKADAEEAKGVAFKPVNLGDAAPAEMLDACITLGRLDDSLDRSPCTLTGEIVAKAEKPRLVYQVDDQSVGCPVFTAEGKLLGLSVLRKKSGGGDDALTEALNVSAVVLPAADVAKSAEQVTSAAK